MTASFEWFVGTRYLLSHKKNGSFLSFISIISILGVVLGVTALTVVVSVMEGLEFELKQKILGGSAHITLSRFGNAPIDHYETIPPKLLKIKDVRRAIPLVQSEGLIVSGTAGTTGVMIEGMNLGDVEGLRDFGLSLIEKDSTQKTPSPFPKILVGKELARFLWLSVGDTVDLIVPQGELTPFGSLPKRKRFKVDGIFKTGLWDYDMRFVYLSMKEAQQFLNIPDVAHAIAVYVQNLDHTEIVMNAIQKSLSSPYMLWDWKQRHGSLFKALKLEKTVMFLILTIIIIVAAFNIIAMLVMNVKEKTKDIAILMAMGAMKKTILRIFILKGSLIGILGTISGLSLGFCFCIVLRDYIRFPLDTQVYHIDTLPVKMDPVNFILIAVCSLAISFAATLYPAWSASKVIPAEGLRSE